MGTITLRVNYSETDQMGVVYHANYLIWFDRARTELMRETGLTYRELEQQGVYLAVSEVKGVKIESVVVTKTPSETTRDASLPSR